MLAGICMQTHTHTHACMRAQTLKRRRGPGALRKSRPTAPAQRSPLGSTTLSEMEDDVPVLGDPWDDLGPGGHGGPSHAAPQVAAQPTAVTAVSAAALRGGAGPPALPAFPS